MRTAEEILRAAQVQCDPDGMDSVRVCRDCALDAINAALRDGFRAAQEAAAKACDERLARWNAEHDYTRAGMEQRIDRSDEAKVIRERIRALVPEGK